MSCFKREEKKRFAISDVGYYSRDEFIYYSLAEPVKMRPYRTLERELHKIITNLMNY